MISRHSEALAMNAAVRVVCGRYRSRTTPTICTPSMWRWTGATMTTPSFTAHSCCPAVMSITPARKAARPRPCGRI